MKVDRHIELLRAQAPRELQIVGEARQAARAFSDDDVVECGVVANDGLSGGFNEIREMRARKTTAQRTNRRCGEHHIADQAQPNQQDLQWLLYGSIVASSISMTGMSSLIGYTR